MEVGWTEDEQGMAMDMVRSWRVIVEQVEVELRMDGGRTTDG